MGASVNTSRVFLGLSVLFLLLGIALVAAGVLSSSWQWYSDETRKEVHLHGLWIDCTQAITALAGTNNNPTWQCKYKFGSAVYGDAAHEAKGYQINTLAMLCCSVAIMLVGLHFACCVCKWPGTVVGWVVCCVVATLISVIGVAYFFISCMSPEYRYITVDKGYELHMGDSFYEAAAGTGSFAVGTVFAILCALLTFLGSGTSSRRIPARTYPKTLDPQNTVV